jgi:hypothetical protein
VSEDEREQAVIAAYERLIERAEAVVAKAAADAADAPAADAADDPAPCP